MDRNYVIVCGEKMPLGEPPSVNLDEDEAELWELFEKQLEEGDSDCVWLECGYYRRFTQAHPYGSGMAFETLTECVADRPLQCIRVQRILRERETEHD